MVFTVGRNANAAPIIEGIKAWSESVNRSKGPRRAPGNSNVAARKLTLPNQVATEGSDDD